METRKPDWLKIHLPGGAHYQTVKSVLQHHHLHTVCDSAHCPNKEECWSNKTATFMILGDVCTRNCRFCNVESSSFSSSPTLPFSSLPPLPRSHAPTFPLSLTPPRLAGPDPNEPKQLAEAVKLLGLKYAVITCVTRDDLPDGGAQHWADSIHAVRELNPDCKIELLISDLQGDLDDLDIILDTKPDVVGHNLETVPRLYPIARPQADYQRSLDVLQHIADRGFISKSGIMVGLGETEAEIETLMRDAAQHGVSLFTIGQYLQPTRTHLPVMDYVHPDTFALYKERGLACGLLHVESGPLVRSSYHAKEVFEQLKNEVKTRHCLVSTRKI